MIKIYLDSSDLAEIKSLKDKVEGVTTNPTLMKKAGVTNYSQFCQQVLEIVESKPVSFEVFADDLEEIDAQARQIARWGNNIYVKVPITLTNGESTIPIITQLQKDAIKINVTAVCGFDQLKQLSDQLLPNAPAIVSVFAGRIADTGMDPFNHISLARKLLPFMTEILWASPREVLNIYQAEQAEANIITCTPELIRKYEKFKNMDLKELSLATVKMFYDDAQASGFKL